MEVRRLSSKRLAAPTFFVRRSPELTLPLKTNNRPRHDALSGGCVGREAGRKQKTQSSKTTFHHKRIRRKQKAAPNGRLYENNLEKTRFSHDIPLYLQ